MLAKGHSYLFFSETVGSFDTKVYMKDYGRMGNVNLFIWVGSHDQDGRYAHIW